MGLGHDAAFLSAAIVSSPLWGYRLWRTGKWRTDWPGRLGRCAPVDHDDRPTALLHAVSVGEVNAIRTLVDQLHRDADWRILISTTTNTGWARAQTLFEPAHRVVRYPLDLSGWVNRFLDALRPDVVGLVELELWPNFAESCRRRDIPLCILNGRLSDTSHRNYRLARPLVRRMFAGLSAVAAQNQTYADRFADLGVPSDRVQVLDTMKWDTAQIVDQVPGAAALAEALGIDPDRPLIVAGSTAPGEDELLISTCPKDAQLLLAPRKPEWFERVARLESGVVRRSRHPDGTTRARGGERLFLLDTIGDLTKAYGLADVAIVGRSFVDLGGSDMMEPAALGKPTISGPHHRNFAATVEAMVEGGGLLVTDQPGPAAADLLADRPRAQALARRGRQVIREHQGATARHVSMLLKLIKGQKEIRRLRQRLSR